MGQGSVSSLDVLPEEILVMCTEYLSSNDHAALRLVSPDCHDFMDRNVPLSYELNDLSFHHFNENHRGSRLGELSLIHFSHDRVNSTELNTLRNLKLCPEINSATVHQLLTECTNLHKLTIDNNNWPFGNVFAESQHTPQYPVFATLKALECRMCVPSSELRSSGINADWSIIFNQQPAQMQDVVLESRTTKNELFLVGAPLFTFLSYSPNLRKLSIKECGYHQPLGGNSLEIHATVLPVAPEVKRKLISLRLTDVLVTVFSSDLGLWSKIFLHQRHLRTLQVKIYSRDTEDGFTTCFLQKIVDNNVSTLKSLWLQLSGNENQEPTFSASLLSPAKQLECLSLTSASDEYPLEITNLHSLPSGLRSLHLHQFDLTCITVNLMLRHLGALEEISVLNREVPVKWTSFRRLVNNDSMQSIRLAPLDQDYDYRRLPAEIHALLESAPSFTPLTLSLARYRNGMDGFNPAPHFLLDFP